MPTTPNRGWVYPTESQNPYYETIEDFFLAQDTDVQALVTGKLALTGGSMTGPIGLYSAGADPSTAGHLQRNGNALRYHYGQGVASLGLVLWTLPAILGTGPNTTETTLGSYTLPANTLTVAGRELHGRFHFIVGATGGTTVRMYVGSSVVYTRVASVAEVSRVELTIRRDAPDAQDVGVTSVTGGAGAGVDRIYISGQSETADIIIRATGQNGTAINFNVAHTHGSIWMLG
jgi:hypothetical protein